jgi:ribosome maturation protein SDO1
MTINPRNNRPYPITLIEKALKEVNFNVNPNKNAKQQVIKLN